MGVVAVSRAVRGMNRSIGGNQIIAKKIRIAVLYRVSKRDFNGQIDVNLN
jgi:hypothetical protein